MQRWAHSSRTSSLPYSPSNRGLEHYCRTATKDLVIQKTPSSAIIRDSKQTHGHPDVAPDHRTK